MENNINYDHLSEVVSFAVMEIFELDFGAITLDNTTYKSEGYKFYDGLLAQLSQFKDGPIKVLQVDIIHNEAVKHLGQEVTDSRAKINTALRSARVHLKIAEAEIGKAKKLLSIEGSEGDIADARLQDFYKSINAEVVDSAQYASLEHLTEMYFLTLPPFESGKDKKNEFPDAIALLAIEGWADEHDVNVIAVSQDKGWRDYAKTSDRITVIASLSEALERFQPHNKVTSIVRYLRQESFLEKKNNIVDQISEAIIDSIDGSDISVDASSHLYYEADVCSATYISHQLDKDQDDLVKVTIVRIGDGSIVLKLGAWVKCQVEANFEFSARDPVDRDYLSLGSDTFTTNEQFHTDILLYVNGDFGKAVPNVDVSRVEILETIKHAEFGEIEPDWTN